MVFIRVRVMFRDMSYPRTTIQTRTETERALAPLSPHATRRHHPPTRPTAGIRGELGQLEEADVNSGSPWRPSTSLPQMSHRDPLIAQNDTSGGGQWERMGATS
jgi:hypothetical protein